MFLLPSSGDESSRRVNLEQSLRVVVQRVCDDGVDPLVEISSLGGQNTCANGGVLQERGRVARQLKLRVVIILVHNRDPHDGGVGQWRGPAVLG